MALVPFGGGGPLFPSPYYAELPLAFTNFTGISASNQLFAWCGFVNQPGMTGTKDIDRIEQISFSTVTKAGGSAMTLSLQGVDATAGPTIRPNGVIGQSVAIANADAGFVSNATYTSGTLSSNRTVSSGEMLAVVLGYDGAGRLGSDSVAVRGPDSIQNNSYWSSEKQSGVCRFDGSAWALANATNNCILRFTDGTFCTLSGVNWPQAGNGSTTWNNTSGVRTEVAATIIPPWDCEVDALYVGVLASNSSDYELILYDASSTALATATVDANQVTSVSARQQLRGIPKTALTGGATYYVSVRPTTANSVTIYTGIANMAANLAAWPGGAQGMQTERLGAGAWATPSTTNRMLAGVRLYSIETGGGGGGLAANMLRGFTA